MVWNSATEITLPVRLLFLTLKVRQPATLLVTGMLQVALLNAVTAMTTTVMERRTPQTPDAGAIPRIQAHIT